MKGFIELDMDVQWIGGRKRNRRHCSNFELADEEEMELPTPFILSLEEPFWAVLG